MYDSVKSNPTLIILFFIFFRNITPSLVSERYTFCHKCFNEVVGDSVQLGDDPSQPPV